MTSLEALYASAAALEGCSLAEIADAHGIPVPPDLKRHKGWIGELLEVALGATAGARAEPDFPELGVELKSVPVDEHGTPRESTYVCTAPLDASIGDCWEEAWVRRKLAHVLWVPVGGGRDTMLGERVIERPLVWRPSPEEDAALRADWEGFREMILLGELWQLRAQRGRALQLRPKAATAREATWVQDAEANWVRMNPLGFYLRRSFTRTVLARLRDRDGGLTVL